MAADPVDPLRLAARTKRWSSSSAACASPLSFALSGCQRAAAVVKANAGVPSGTSPAGGIAPALSWISWCEESAGRTLSTFLNSTGDALAASPAASTLAVEGLATGTALAAAGSAIAGSALSFTSGAASGFASTLASTFASALASTFAAAFAATGSALGSTFVAGAGSTLAFAGSGATMEIGVGSIGLPSGAAAAGLLSVTFTGSAFFASTTGAGVGFASGFGSGFRSGFGSALAAGFASTAGAFFAGSVLADSFLAGSLLPLALAFASVALVLTVSLLVELFAAPFVPPAALAALAEDVLAGSAFAFTAAPDLMSGFAPAAPPLVLLASGSLGARRANTTQAITAARTTPATIISVCASAMEPRC